MEVAAPARYDSVQAHRSQLSIAVRQFCRNRLAVAGVALLCIFVALALAGPLVAPYDPIKPDLRSRLASPGGVHWLGTDHFGRDVLSRVIYGSRVTLTVGLLVALLSVAAGVPAGLLSGYVGGRTDNLMMRLMDALLAFPPLLLAIAIVASMGQNVHNLVVALSITNIPIFARLARGSTLSAREEVFVSAAEALGASQFRITWLHILPNIMAPIVVQMTFVFSRTVISEASMSFLGLGIPPPASSWGRDLSEARRYLEDAYWLVLSPTTAIMLAVLSLNFVGDGLRDALDPRFRNT